MTLTDRLKVVAGVLARSARLGPRDGAVCFVAWCLLHAATVRLRLGRFIPWRKPAADTWRTDPRPGRPLDAGGAERLARLFGLAAEHRALGTWCLPRAVALRQLLRLHGFAAQLALGLRPSPEGLKGHAWVVYDGVVLDQDAAFAGSFVRCEVS